jgi:hypothetical protein
MRDEEAQKADISTTISRRSPTTPTTSSTPSPLPQSNTTKDTIGLDGDQNERAQILYFAR